MLTSNAVLHLRLFLITALKQDPPRTGILANLSFSLWLSKKLSEADFALMEDMEKELGEEVCNQWMVEVLTESGIYESDEPGFVQGVA
jgi:hypothetical protein